MILIFKLYRRVIPKVYTQRYRLYLNRRDVRSQLQMVRQTRGRKSGIPGEVYDLEQVLKN
ncbi:MAG: hypothetical protein WKF37_04065 [Bryobacteraceae bacterium]